MIRSSSAVHWKLHFSHQTVQNNFSFCWRSKRINHLLLILLPFLSFFLTLYLPCSFHLLLTSEASVICRRPWGSSPLMCYANGGPWGIQSKGFIEGENMKKNRLKATAAWTHIHRENTRRDGLNKIDTFVIYFVCTLVSVVKYLVCRWITSLLRPGSSIVLQKANICCSKQHIFMLSSWWMINVA